MVTITGHLITCSECAEGITEHEQWARQAMGLERNEYLELDYAGNEVRNFRCACCGDDVMDHPNHFTQVTDVPVEQPVTLSCYVDSRGYDSSAKQDYTFMPSDLTHVRRWTNVYGNSSYVLILRSGVTLLTIDNTGTLNELGDWAYQVEDVSSRRVLFADI